MIEIREENGSFYVYEDGNVLDKTTVRAEFSEEGFKYRIYVKSPTTTKFIFPYKISQIDDVKLLSLQIGSSNKNKKNITIITDDLRNEETVYKYKVSLVLPTINRREGFSFSDYCEQLEKVIENSNDNDIYPKAEFSRTRYRRVEISFSRLLLPLSIEEEINKLFEVTGKFHSETILALQVKKDTSLHSIVTSFNFPEKIKVSCEQYLLYFIQFLKDFGISATPNFKDEAGKVLFSVTPTGDVEALGKIREALAVYLKLPSSSISDIEYSENFALMRLQQQVRNLQHSQQMAKTEILSTQYALNLAQQNIDNQDRIIVRQNSVIEDLGDIIEKITSNAVMIDSVEKKEQKEEFEEIYEGVRSGESKWFRELTGIGLNLPKLISATVKNTFGKNDENKSVLGLNEKD